uniref:Uncharacterized protein n=1 Tax=Knipowitschia caucasica TaxID=637954 RepID=A0AAV2L359_KNICA
MKKSAPQNLTYYFSAMRGAAESGGYNAWPPNTALHSRPQVSNWPHPLDMPHFDYHGVFNPQNMCSLPDTDFKAGEQISRAVPTTAIGQGTAQ